MNRSAPPLRLLLGVSAGIAAYKTVELVRRLRERGAEVRVVMTEAAARFVTPLTFQALSGHPVRTSLWDEAAEAAMGHIELARWADQIVIAPASADLIARLAHGHAGDLLTTLCLASEAPLTLAPAMNRLMWAHPATQANVALLTRRGVRVIGPAEGSQACGESGPGRMLEPEQIAAALFFSYSAILAGQRVVVTAGPTLEDIDPVRFIGNRSSGRMGFALAAAAQTAGAQVVLIAGPVALPTPMGVQRIDVRSALEMQQAVMDALPDTGIFIAAAAVADYRPASLSEQKIKKSAPQATLTLVRNPDILAEVAACPRRPFVVGFAAETEQLEKHARAKLEKKKLDLIAANWVGRSHEGFAAESNALLVLWPGGQAEIPSAGKRIVAEALITLIAKRIAEQKKEPA